jgi:hypothetical protein
MTYFHCDPDNRFVGIFENLSKFLRKYSSIVFLSLTQQCWCTGARVELNEQHWQLIDEQWQKQWQQDD